MPDIRPMSFGEILDGSLKLYRHNFGLFIQLAIASLAVPAALFLWFAFTRMEALQMMMMGGLMMGMVDWSIILFMLVIGLAWTLGTLMLQAATISVVSESYLGRAPGFGQAIGLGASKIVPLFLVGLGKNILLGLIYVICFAAVAATFVMTAGMGGAGLGWIIALAVFLLGAWFLAWVATGYAMTTPVVVLEQLRSAFDAFGRSWDLTRGSRLRIVGLAIVAWLLFLVVPWVVLQIITALVAASSPALGVGFAILSILGPVILYPALTSVFVLIYYDLRVRREAFDLQMLSQQLGV